MSSTLRLASARYLLRHPWQAGLSVLGIALGLAVVVAVALASESARRAFELSTEAVTGRATHQLTGGPTGLPDGLYRRLRVDLGVRPIAPVVDGYVRTGPASGRTLRLLGLDPFAEGPFRPYLGDAVRADPRPLLTTPGAVVLGAEEARGLGLRAGSGFSVWVRGQPHRLWAFMDPPRTSWPNRKASPLVICCRWPLTSFAQPFERSSIPPETKARRVK